MRRLDILLQLIAAGAFGAFTAVPFHKDVQTTGQRVSTIFGGICCAFFLAPLVANFFKINSDYVTGVGFLLGVFGMSMVGAIITAIRNFDIAGFIKSKFGGSQ